MSKKTQAKKQNKKFRLNDKQKEVLEKIKKSKYTDVFLVLLILGILLSIHHAAFVPKDDDYYNYYINEEGLPHLYDMDSYYYSRKVKEFVSGDNKKLILKRSEDPLQTNISDKDDGKYTLLLSKIVSIIYKIVHVFKDVSLYKVITYSSPFLSILVAIPVYIFMNRRTNRLGAFFGGVLAGVSIPYFSHWAYGCFDTDILLFIMPVMYICSFIECVIAKEKKSRIIWIVLSSIAFSLLIVTWDVFGVYYFLVLASILALLIIALIKNKFDFKKVIKLPEIYTSLICFGIYTILSLIINKSIEISILKDVLSVFKTSGVINEMDYPNPGQFTSELLKLQFADTSSLSALLTASSVSIVNKMGGGLILLCVTIGAIMLLRKIFKYVKSKDNDCKEDYIVGIVLLIWLIGGFLSVTVGSRFVKLAVIPSTLVAAYAIGMMYKNLKLEKSKIPLIILCLSFLLTPCIGANDIANGMGHSADDALVETGNRLKKETKENTVIATWWDYGYFFEYQSERRAIADGGTYNGRFLFYLANALVTTSELQSANTFKMLADSGASVSYVADEIFKKPKYSTVAVLDALNTKTAEEAQKLLVEKYNITEDQAKEITKYTHPELDYEIVLVITESMLRMKGPFNHFAHYEFDTGEETQIMLDEDAVYLRLYEKDEDTKYFTHMFRNTDPIGRLSTNVFLIK